MLIIRERVAEALPASEELVLTYEHRRKSRLRTRLASGREAGLFLDRTGALRDGERLRADDGTIVRVVAAPEALAQARCADAAAFARCAYHLGNRHAPVQIRWEGAEGVLLFLDDAVLADMVAGLGAAVTRVVAPFEPEAGAYAAGHSHHSGEQRHTGIIHDHFGRRG
jgi:urease accessory protein